MTPLFQKFRRDSAGATMIEYGLMAAVMGTGVALSLNYLSSEFDSMMRTHVCAEKPGFVFADKKKYRCDEFYRRTKTAG